MIVDIDDEFMSELNSEDEMVRQETYQRKQLKKEREKKQIQKTLRRIKNEN